MSHPDFDDPEEPEMLRARQGGMRLWHIGAFALLCGIAWVAAVRTDPMTKPGFWPTPAPTLSGVAQYEYRNGYCDNTSRQGCIMARRQATVLP